VNLNLGVIDELYSTPPASGRRNRRSKGGSVVSTGQVAEWLEQEYHIMEHFYQLHEQEIIDAIADDTTASLETMLMGGSTELHLGEATSKIEDAFKNMISSSELETIGYALYSNDLTQTGSWTATNVTAVLNATGPDNVANSASTITATSAGGTILQAITLASQADTYSVYVLCVTCTGNIQVAEYPPATPAFTTLSSSNCFNQSNVGTAPNTSTWVRCFVEATILNPVVGFKIANSGDSVQVFCNQLEPGAFESPCIPTTTLSASRSADNIAVKGALLAPITTQSFSTVIATQLAAMPSAAAFILGTTSASNYFMARASSTTIQFDPNNAGAVTATSGSGSFSSGTQKSGLATANGNTSLVLNAGAVATSSTAFASASSIFLGSRNGTATFLDGDIGRATLWGSKLPDVQLQSLTSP
jgi:hypothetical protein